jgi:DNA repair protein RecN (Recombination protein N)
MLTHLTIKNYALIRHLELTPSGGLNVVTGETGAGKSIMLGALGLLLGNRADTKVLWDENEKCVTEGSFQIGDYKLKSFFKAEDLDYDEVTTIRREISPGGKSRAFINDTPVTLEVMKKLGSMLMDIHSQHETLQLGNYNFQLRLIDAYADNVTLREAYAEKWSAFVQARKAYETLQSEADTLRKDADYIRFQLDELKQANLEPGEQEELESELQIKEHAEEIKTRFQSILGLLSGNEYAATQGLAEARTVLQHIVAYSPAYEALYSRLESLRIELNDITAEIEREGENVEFDPARLSFVQERLGTLYRLLKKHRLPTVTELIALQESLQEKDSITSNLDEALENARLAYDRAKSDVGSAATRLSESRKKAITPLCKQLTKLLHELGIPEASLQIEITVTEPGVNGIDRPEILFSANKGIATQPLARVASGGEFSRVMFCIKYILTERTAMPTLILDEIDTGISGEVAFKLGAMMKDMAKKHQIITITHLPQIAAKGEAHYFVYKDNSASKTISAIRQLAAKERVEEIAKMIGGANPTRVALQNAQELLAH